MRTSQAARYARWAAAAATLLAATVAGVYGWRAWQAAQARQRAPEVVPPTVQQRSAEFSFSKVEGDRTLFTVRASRTTEFKEGSKSLLEEVWITIYGRSGRRFDNIHTRSCDYEPQTGRITCAGEVQIVLESAEEARERPGERAIHIRTANISFGRESGEARTAEPVEFRFPYGAGRGVGVIYSTQQAAVRVQKDVEFTLEPAVRPEDRKDKTEDGKATRFTASSLEYRRGDRTLHLNGPVRVQQGTRELTAGRMTLELDAALRARRLHVQESPQLRALEPTGELLVTARELVALFHPEGWAERVLAEENVLGKWQAAGGESRFRAHRLDLELAPGTNAPRRMTATGSVRLERGAGSPDSRTLETEALRFTFAPAGGARHLERAETLAPGVVEWVSSEERTGLRGGKLTAVFGARNRIQQLAGAGGVEIERRFPGGAAQTSRSEEFAAAFGPGGEWTRIEQRGAVNFRDANRSAQAGRAVILRAAETIELSGSATVTDGPARTTAQTIVFNQRTGEMRAESSVRTSYRAAEPAGVTNLASQPAHISAESLRARSDTGRALYTGRARLWQGGTVIEAAAIELFRNERKLEARGSVVGLFPQDAAPSPATATPSEPLVWRVRAGSLVYWSAERRARLEENVAAESHIGQMAARTMDLYFGAGLERAEAGGGVTVREGARRGTAERADYFAREGKFVLSGGKPTLFDAARGTTTGRQLTFFLADDRILIDSDEGSRTLTRHRVEK